MSKTDDWLVIQLFNLIKLAIELHLFKWSKTISTSKTSELLGGNCTIDYRINIQSKTAVPRDSLISDHVIDGKYKLPGLEVEADGYLPGQGGHQRLDVLAVD